MRSRGRANERIGGQVMERIYTIPVNEAFDDSRDHPECGCPLERVPNKGISRHQSCRFI